MRVRIKKFITVNQVLTRPKSPSARKYREVILRSVKSFYRLYSVVASPGCVRVRFEEVKGERN